MYVPIKIGFFTLNVNGIYWIKAKPGRKCKTTFVWPFS